MAPYLQTVRSFADVAQSDAGVDTLEFLEASKGLVGIFGLLNSAVLSPVSSDISGNITKVQTRYDATPDKSTTLEELVRNEIAEKKKTATEGLLWLTRGMSFTCKALQATQAVEDKELSVAFNESYVDTLRPFHNFVVKAVFSTAMRACPRRDDLYSKLKEDKEGGPAATQEELDEQLNTWLAALDQIVDRIDAFYETNGYKKGL